MILEKKLLPLQPFVIELKALGPGKSAFEWKTGREFFESFGNSDVLDAGIAVSATLVNHGLTIDVACEIRGSVTVPCDRCLEPLELPVDTSFEETFAPESHVLDLNQDVYDFVMTSLPMQRVHGEGGCNSETTKFIVEN